MRWLWASRSEPINGETLTFWHLLDLQEHGHLAVGEQDGGVGPVINDNNENKDNND